MSDVQIVGIGEAGVGRVGGGVSPLDLLGLSVDRALADAGVGMEEVDGLFTASAYYPFAALNVADHLGLAPKYSDGTNVGGSSFIAHLEHASAAISQGLCNVAIICYGSTQWSDGGRLVTIAERNRFEVPYDLRVPFNAYSLVAARHMYEYGTTREQLAHVAVAARGWAKLNPNAVERGDLSVDDVLQSRMVAWPLSKLDSCLVTDGAACVVLTSKDRARDSPKGGVSVLSSKSAHWHRDMSQMRSYTTTAASESGPRALESAGVDVDDIDLAMLYDAFTINVPVFLEDLGFCKKGEGGPFITERGIGPNGGFPVNTNGGGLSYGHPGMYGMFLVTEAVRQLRGECGDRQVPGCELALLHGNGGVFSHQSTAVISKN